jgi:hypothetical protein
MNLVKQSMLPLADLIRSDRFQQRRGRTRQPSRRLHNPSHRLRQNSQPPAAERDQCHPASAPHPVSKTVSAWVTATAQSRSHSISVSHGITGRQCSMNAGIQSGNGALRRQAPRHRGALHTNGVSSTASQARVNDQTNVITLRSFQGIQYTYPKAEVADKSSAITLIRKSAKPTISSSVFSSSKVEQNFTNLNKSPQW